MTDLVVGDTRVLVVGVVGAFGGARKAKLRDCPF